MNENIEQLRHLADCYEERGEYANAEIAYRKAIALQEEGSRPTSAEYLTDVFNLALLCYAQDNYDEAERLLSRVLDAEIEALGPQSESTRYTREVLKALRVERGLYALSPAPAADACTAIPLPGPTSQIESTILRLTVSSQRLKKVESS